MWKYIKHNSDGEEVPNQPQFPPKGTIFRAFDAFRWKQVIGYTERGIGCGSMLNPNMDDDCCLIAFAPLDEPTQPDEAKLREAWSRTPCYPRAEVPKLLLSKKVT